MRVLLQKISTEAAFCLEGEYLVWWKRGIKNQHTAIMSFFQSGLWAKRRVFVLVSFLVFAFVEYVQTPVAFASSAVLNISVGDSHSCVLLMGGSIKCWGNNSSGQLGDGTTTNRFGPVAVSGIKNAVAVSAGYRHSCALLVDKSVKCWGDNSLGQLGDGTTTSSLFPITVSGVNNATAVSAGFYHSCAVLADRSVECWGYNEPSPFFVPEISNVKAISVGSTHNCAVLMDGSVKCWGENWAGQLGDGTFTGSSVPVAASGITNATAVGVGFYHTCVVLADGGVRCWGNNVYYQLGSQLGDRTITKSSFPVVVPGIDNAVSIIGSGQGHSCALLMDGSIKCWGGVWAGQLGDGSITNTGIPIPITPVAVFGITNAVTISVGQRHSCALLFDGGVKCWGGNDYGQLGDYTTVNRPIPVFVIGWLGNVNQPPTVTLLGNNPITITQGDTFIDPGAVATDAEDGDITGNIVVSGEVDTENPSEYTLTYSVTDSGGLSASVDRTVVVKYRFDGFLQPINDTAHQIGQDVSVFKAGSTVPVKFQLKRADGTVVRANAEPIWSIPVKGLPMNAAIDEGVYTLAPTSGLTYRWDSIDQQYIYNWSTKGLEAGYWYHISASLDDGSAYTVTVGLR